MKEISAKNRIRAAYDTAEFGANAESVARRMREYFEKVASATSTVEYTAPAALVAKATKLLEDGAPLEDLVGAFFHHAHRLHSPHYMGHQVPPAVPVAGLFDSLSLVTNQGIGIYEMGPFGTAVERAIVRKLIAKIGWGDEADGFGTHGGSLANLTGVLAARNIKYPASWRQGVAGPRPAVFTCADSHYSVARAAGITGLGSDAVVKVRPDEKRRMRGPALEAAIADARARGMDPFCIVASSCSTPTGSFDPLDECADVAEKHGLWLHVDGAHGASVLFSRRFKPLVKGIERADSITWDAHKMLFVPCLSTFLLFKRKEDSYRGFQQDAPYLFDPHAPGLAEYDLSLRTLECTKRAVALGLWGTWSLYGEGIFEDLIDTTFDIAREFHAILEAAPDFEPTHQPEANILCFRHVPEHWRVLSEGEISARQGLLRRRLVETGEFYITATTIEGRGMLRVTLINPFTEKKHLEALLESLRKLGQKL